MDDVTPGNPQGIRELAQHWTQQGQTADSAASTLRAATNNIEGGTLRLRGDFAPRIQDAIGDLPGELEKLARGYRLCGQALDNFASRLTAAQQKSGTAANDLDVASRAKRNAEYDLDTLAPGWEVWADDVRGRIAYVTDHFGAQAEPVQAAIARREQATRDVSLADDLARQAAGLRGDAERDCVREINHALEDSGLQNRKWWQKVGDYLKESFTTWDGFVKLCENISMVLGVVALFLTGPLALIVGAILLITAVAALADTLKQFHDGKIGWKDLAVQAGWMLLSRFGGKALKGAFTGLSRTKFARGLIERAGRSASRLGDRLRVGDRARNLANRALCTVTGHPVDVATGKVFTDHIDLELPGPLPLTFQRVWYSTSTYSGPLGHGWHHSFDAALYVTADAVLYRTPDGRTVDLLPLYPDTSYYERQERLTVSRDGSGYRIRDADGVTYRFAPLPRLTAEGGDRPADEPVTHVLRDVINRAGQRISLSYDDRGRLDEIVDSGGRELRFEHDESDRTVALTAPHPDPAEERFTVARYGYDELGDLVTFADALDQLVRYEYSDHLLVRETNRNELSFYFEYDGSNERARCVHTWGDGGIYDHRLSYEAGLTRVVNSLGQATRHEHDGGLVVRTIDPLEAETWTAFEYQQLVREVDPLGRVTAIKYDHRGNPELLSEPDGAETRTSFDERDLPLGLVDRVGGQWAWSYDHAGLLVGRTDPLERRWAFQYRAGLLTSITDPVGGLTALDYDEQGSLSAISTPDGATGGWQHNRLGWAVSSLDPLGNQERRRFDLLGRVVQVEEPDGNVRQRGYDGESNVLSEVDRRTERRFGYSGLNRLASRTEGGTTVRFEYDTEERLTGVVNAHGQVYGFDYGPTGELATESGFDDVLRLYERDLAGRVTSIRRASGMVTRYEYDAGDRPVAVAHSDGTREQFGYRADGLLIMAENGTAVLRFERDLVGQVIRETQRDHRAGREHWVSTEYDGLGSRVRMASSLGVEQLIERDSVGAVTGVSATEGSDDFNARFSRDSLGQELVRELPGGVRSRWHRDRLGRPIRHELTGASERVSDRAYEWDVDGQLNAVLNALSGPVRFEHDALGQLRSALHSDGRLELRMPDSVGNLFRTADRTDRVYGPSGQLLESIDTVGRRVRYEYNPEGCLVTKRASDGERWSYRWDADGCLTEVSRPDGSVVRFGYDPLGRRVSKSFRGQITRWVWDGNRPLHEWVEFGARSALPEVASPITWLFEPDSFAPLARLGVGRAESMVTDQVGAPVAMFDQVGALTWAAELSIWGELELRVGARGDCPFRWPGQYDDPETGLYYNRFRYYDPDSGQYLSQDPIGLLGGLAVAAYVANPLVEADPLGLAAGPVVFPPGDLSPHGITTVVITMPGARNRDFTAADKEAGRLAGLFQNNGAVKSQPRPKGYTWHHLADFDPQTGTTAMQLVRTKVHGGIGHVGSVDQFQKHFGVKYDSMAAKRISEAKGWLTTRPLPPLSPGGC